MEEEFDEEELRAKGEELQKQMNKLTEMSQNREEFDDEELSAHSDELLKQIEQFAALSQSRMEDYVSKHYWRKEPSEIKYYKIKSEDNELREIFGTVGEDVQRRAQVFESIEARNQAIADKIALLENDSYVEVEFHKMQVLFVQIQTASFDDKTNSEVAIAMKLSDLQMEVSNFLDHKLYQKGLGASFAWDLGYGINILFEVYELEKSFEVILQGLKEKQLENTTIIAKRINITKDDWDHEVIHPADFKGEFYSY